MLNTWKRITSASTVMCPHQSGDPDQVREVRLQCIRGPTIQVMYHSGLVSPHPNAARAACSGWVNAKEHTGYTDLQIIAFQENCRLAELQFGRQSGQRCSVGQGPDGEAAVVVEVLKSAHCNPQHRTQSL